MSNTILELNNQKLVSVVVPVYNVGYLLHKTIDSIIKQSYKNSEIIIVDDGANDYGAYICDEYCCDFDNIKVIHKLNGGLGSARNYGIDLASGDYVYFVDGDDYIEYNLIEKVIKVTEQNQCDCCAFGMIKEFSDGRTEKYHLFQEILK